MPEHREVLMYPNLHHVGVIVRDMNEAGRDNSKRFGLGDVVRRMTLHLEGALYRGRRITFSAEFGFIDVGNTVIELIQPLGSDSSPYLDALEKAGEGTHHLAFVVPSIDEHLATARAANPSLSLTLDTNLPKRMGRFVYVEGLVHGALIELIEFFPQSRS
jgi:catechol 2,3-dioxygenase-like lactoylglutathione lyase family enzyme